MFLKIFFKFEIKSALELVIQNFKLLYLLTDREN